MSFWFWQWKYVGTAFSEVEWLTEEGAANGKTTMLIWTLSERGRTRRALFQAVGNWTRNYKDEALEKGLTPHAIEVSAQVKIWLAGGPLPDAAHMRATRKPAELVVLRGWAAQ